MGRFSSFVAKAGDLVQQANEEYQRTRNQQQQQSGYSAQPDPQYMTPGYGYSNTSSQYGSNSTHPQNPQQAAYPPPPLPPRRPSPPNLSHQASQQDSTHAVHHGYTYGIEQSLAGSAKALPNPQPLYAQNREPAKHDLGSHQRTAYPQQEARAAEAEGSRESFLRPVDGEERPSSQRKPVPPGYEAGQIQKSSVDNELAQQIQGRLVAQEAPQPPPRPSIPPRQPEETTSPLPTPSVPKPKYVAPSVEDEAAHPPRASIEPAPGAPETVPQSSSGVLIPIKECITTPVYADVDWFVHKSAPDFLVCSRCFVDYIYDSTLQDSFPHQRFDDFEKVSRKCFFGSDHVKNRLWPIAAAAGSMDNMLGYMTARPRIAECPQQTSLEKHEWWMTPEVPGLVFCQACWSDDLEGGPFASHFHLETLEQPHVCSSSMPFIGRMYELHKEANNWEEFAAEAKGRFTIPPCPQEKAISGNAHAWVKSTREPKALQICYACFADYFYGTTSADSFQQVALNEDTTICCLMGHLYIKIPAQQAVAKKDPELFWKWIEEVDKHPFCSKQGITGSTSWYTLPNQPPGFAVCGACRAGIAGPIGWSKHLIPIKDVSADDTILCCFNPAHIRFAEFMTFLSQEILTDTWERLGNYAATFANVPRCPRDSTATRANRRYWGWQSLRICEECYHSFAKGTALESLFHLKGEVIDKSRLCDLYSPRMRKMYTDACDGRFSAQELVDLAGQRRMVYIHTMPEVDRLISQQRIKAMQATMYGAMGSSYKSMGASQDAVMGHTYTLGNAYAGYGHVNGLSLTGAEYDRKGRDLAAEVTGGSVWHQISMLEKRWREVE